MDTNANKASGRPIQTTGQNNRPTHGAVDSKFVNGQPRILVNTRANNPNAKPIKVEGQNNGHKGVNLVQKVYGSNNPKMQPKPTKKQTPYGA